MSNPLSVVVTDLNGNNLTITGSSVRTDAQRRSLGICLTNPTPVVLCDLNGNPLVLGTGGGTWASLTGDLTISQVLPWDGPTPGTPDTGISRIGAATLAVGNGTAGDYSGVLKCTELIVHDNGANQTISLPSVNSAIQFGSNSSGPSGLISWLNNVSTVKFGLGCNQYDSNGDFEIFNGSGDIFNLGAATGSIMSPTGAVHGWGTIPSGTPVFDTGISRLGAASIAIGNGTAADVTGSLSLKKLFMSDFGSAPTSAGTAGTAGEIVYHSGLAYLCTVTGAAGAATWNKLNMTAV